MTSLAPALVVTIDVDGPLEYAAVHGLSPAISNVLCMHEDDGPLQRFISMCNRLQCRATIFLIARDVHGQAQTALRQLAADRFELACHSYHHDYGLSQRSVGAIVEDVHRARQHLRQSLAAEVSGFRAPGYTMSTALLDAVVSAGFRYDSSVLSSPVYYGLKAVVMAWYNLRGRRTQAIRGSMAALGAPRLPYRPAEDPYRRGERRIIEIPISVTGRLRLPLTGALLLGAPAWARRRIVANLARQPLVVINLHAIEFLDVGRDEFPAALAARQPELRLPLAERVARISSVISALMHSHASRTLNEVAREWRQKLDNG